MTTDPKLWFENLLRTYERIREKAVGREVIEQEK